MSDSTKSIDVIIRILSEKHGADEVEAALGRVKAGATGLAAPATSSFEEIGKKTSELTGKQSELKHALGEVGREFPEVGRLAKAALNPLTLTIGSIIFAIGALKKAHEALMQALNTGMDSGSFQDGMSKVTDALVAGRIEAGSFARELNKIATEEESIKSKTDAAIQSIHDQAAAQAEIQDAQKGLALAKVNAAEENGPEKGGISHVQAIQARAAIEKYYQDLKRNAEEATHRQEEVARQNEKNTTKAKADAAAAAVPGARAEATKAEVGDVRATNLVANAKKVAEQVTAHIAAVEEEFSVTRLNVRTGKLERNVDHNSIPSFIKEDLASSRAVLGQAKGIIDKYDSADATVARGKQLKDAEDILTAAQQHATELLRRYKELSDQLPREEQSHRTTEAGHRAADTIHDQQRAVETGTEIKKEKDSERKEQQKEADKAGRVERDERRKRGYGDDVSFNSPQVPDIGSAVKVALDDRDKQWYAALEQVRKDVEEARKGVVVVAGRQRAALLG